MANIPATPKEKLYALMSAEIYNIVLSMAVGHDELERRLHEIKEEFDHGFYGQDTFHRFVDSCYQEIQADSSLLFLDEHIRFECRVHEPTLRLLNIAEEECSGMSVNVREPVAPTHQGAVPELLVSIAATRQDLSTLIQAMRDYPLN